MGNLLRRVADWCVPASSLRWGQLTLDDGYAIQAYRAPRVGLATKFDTRVHFAGPYVGPEYPTLADVAAMIDLTPFTFHRDTPSPRPTVGDLVELRGDGETWGYGIVMDSNPNGWFTARFLRDPDEDA